MYKIKCSPEILKEDVVHESNFGHVTFAASEVEPRVRRTKSAKAAAATTFIFWEGAIGTTTNQKRIFEEK